MELKPDPSNPRKHSGDQIRAIARSINAFGFNAPILIDKNKQIVAGHGRYEAAKLIRSKGLANGVMLAALTGWGQMEDKRRAEEAGADLFLTKPFSPLDLLRLVDRLGTQH